MSNNLDMAITLYILFAVASVINLMFFYAEENGKHHWTMPFAGFLWPILAIIGVYITWVNLNE